MGIKFSSFPIRGIDVSSFNGNIDWSKVSANFAAIRVGYGRVTDSKFIVNWQNAKGKVNRLPYWYMDYYSNHNSGSAVYGKPDADWGKEQAETCWNKIQSDPEGIVFLDIESGGSSYSPPIATVSTRAQTIAKAFLERMDALNGKVNGIYCSLGLLNWFSTWFRTRPVWVAWYNEAQTVQSVVSAVSKAGWTGNCVIWQYASNGDINDDGVADGQSMGMESKFLDLNAWMRTSQEYTAFFGKDTAVALYRVKTLISNLNVRMGPGIIYPVLRRADFPANYNIYEEKNGFGRISSTKSEWFSLSTQYVQKLDSTTPPQPEKVLYKVKTLITNLLVRSGPGMTYSKLRLASYPAEYSIYEEKNGYGRISTSASEWISLNSQYVQRLDTAPASSGSTQLYKVKILIYNLMVRSGPGTIYPSLRRANFPGEYIIYEEKNGYGRINASKSEWISLSSQYVQRLTSSKAVEEFEILAKLWEAHPELH